MLAVLVPPYHYFHISPKDDADALPLEEALKSIRIAFPDHETDEAAALKDAKHRHECLVALKAPKEIIAVYENPRIVRVRITEGWCIGAYLEFDLWEKKGFYAYPKPDDDFLAPCESLATKVAELLGYEVALEEYD